MSARCSIDGCRAAAGIDYLGRGVCTDHWNQLNADDAPPDALRMALGITAAETATEETMDTTETPTTETTATPKPAGKRKAKGTPAAQGARAAKADDAKRARAKGGTAARLTKENQERRRVKKDAAAHRVFAIRVTDAELAAIHKAAGPRNATRMIRAVTAAFAARDEAAFRAVLEEARKARA